MKTPLAELRLRAELAQLEVQLAEQRMQFEGLIREARTLMILHGESTHVPIQFDQHAWLRTANAFFPPL